MAFHTRNNVVVCSHPIDLDIIITTIMSLPPKFVKSDDRVEAAIDIWSSEELDVALDATPLVAKGLRQLVKEYAAEWASVRCYMTTFTTTTGSITWNGRFSRGEYNYVDAILVFHPKQGCGWNVDRYSSTDSGVYDKWCRMRGEPGVFADFLLCKSAFPWAEWVDVQSCQRFVEQLYDQMSAAGSLAWVMGKNQRTDAVAVRLSHKPLSRLCVFHSITFLYPEMIHQIVAELRLVDAMTAKFGKGMHACADAKALEALGKELGGFSDGKEL